MPKLIIIIIIIIIINPAGKHTSRPLDIRAASFCRARRTRQAIATRESNIREARKSKVQKTIGAKGGDGGAVSGNGRSGETQTIKHARYGNSQSHKCAQHATREAANEEAAQTWPAAPPTSASCVRVNAARQSFARVDSQHEKNRACNCWDRNLQLLLLSTLFQIACKLSPACCLFL